MSLAKLAACGGLAAIALSACGIQAKPLAGTRHLGHARGNHAVYDDPRTVHESCLRDDGYHIHLYLAAGGVPAIQVGKPPTGPTVLFYPSGGSAEYLKITSLRAQGGMMIGAALEYPNRASTQEAEAVANCLDIGVPG